MKKSQIILLAFFAVLALVSCGPKEYDITMTMVEDGNLRIRLLNDADQGIQGVNVVVGNYSAPLAENETDAEGWVYFNDLLAGTYTIGAEDITVNGRIYNVVQQVQVLAGIDKEYLIHPAEYSGSVTISVLDNFNYEPLANLNVGVFNNDDYQPSYDFEDILDICVATGVTSAQGIVTFDDLPLGYYGVLLYIDEDDSEWNTDEFSIVEKGQEREIYFYFDIF